MLRQLRITIVLLLFFLLLTGIVYPFLTLGIARLVFPRRSAGSLLLRHGRVVGSALLGQELREPAYFWSRPSATVPVPYDAQASGASNLALTNPLFLAHVRRRLSRLRARDPAAPAAVPIDLVTSSGSGLDPDISLAAALWQIPRISAAGGLSPKRLEALVKRYTERPLLPFLGPPVVTVLPLDLALHHLYEEKAAGTRVTDGRSLVPRSG